MEPPPADRAAAASPCRPLLPAVATGHYARLAPPEGSEGSGSDGGSSSGSSGEGGSGEGGSGGSAGGGVPRLLRGLDHHKDQTYFLASVQPAALRRVLFPVGHLQVR